MQGDYDKSRWFGLTASGSLETIREELQKYPKPFLLNMVDNTPSRHTGIFYVVQDRNLSRSNDIVELLLSEGANANFKDSLSQTPLFFAARFGHLRHMELLLSHGADINHKDTYGQTALYYCSREGQTDAVALLARSGADVNVVDNLGQTAIFYACREGKFEATKVLTEAGANLNHTDKSRNIPLTLARKSGNSQLVAYLLEKGALDKNSKKKKDGGRSDRKKEKRIKCQLMVADSHGEKRVLTDEELKEFEEKYPDIAKYWLEPDTVNELDKMDVDSLDNIRPWEKPAKKLLNILWRNQNAWIFHEKVDPIQLGIPDYFDIVKNPMDFSTIKKKLNNNVYGTGFEFIADLELVFYNCKLYNPPGTEVANMCANVQNSYETQLPMLGLDKYRILNNE